VKNPRQLKLSLSRSRNPRGRPPEPHPLVLRSDLAIDRSPPRRLGAESAVAKPRTWFLIKGWRLHGLLDPNEIPGVSGA
jgi:hypothetical protein